MKQDDAKRDKMYLGVMIILAVILIIVIAKKIIELNNPVVVVDYGRSFVQMRDAGKYDIVNIELITEQNFPLQKRQGRVRVMIKIFASPEEMRGQGFRPAFVEELFALGEQYPDLQKKFKILALSSPWRREDHTEYPCLGWDKGFKRYLCVAFTTGAQWRSDMGYVFAGARERD